MLKVRLSFPLFFVPVDRFPKGVGCCLAVRVRIGVRAIGNWRHGFPTTADTLCCPLSSCKGVSQIKRF